MVNEKAILSSLKDDEGKAKDEKGAKKHWVAETSQIFERSSGKAKQGINKKKKACRCRPFSDNGEASW